jgi:hypothetical protein
MAISKWLIVLLCAGLIVTASVTTTMFVSSQECNSNINQKNSDSAFKNQPTIRGGSKGY